MSAPVIDLAVHRCLVCSAEENHPKIHLLYGKNFSTGEPDFAHIHHDCTEGTPWHEQLVGDPSGEGEKLRAIIDRARSGVRGHALRGFIEEHIPTIGNGPTMASGMAVAQAEAIVAAMHINSSTATIGTVTITGPINIRAMATNPTSDNNAGTEITTGNSYTSGGTGLGAPTFGTVAIVSNVASITTITAALNKTNMPAATIVGLAEYDSSATKLPTWWGSVTTLTTNSGDTVSIAIGALVDTLQ